MFREFFLLPIIEKWTEKNNQEIQLLILECIKSYVKNTKENIEN